MLFPDGKFTPAWLRYLVPFLVATMLGIYIFPDAPFYWRSLKQSTYVIVTTAWYSVGFLTSIYRYTRSATIEQKQKIRWVFTGTSGPFLWFVVFEVLQIFIPAFSDQSIFAASFEIVARVSSIFLFLMLPLFITVSIARNNLFDIDLIINRSLVYGSLTVGLGLAFAAALGLISLIFKNVHPGDQSLLVATIFLFQQARYSSLRARNFSASWTTSSTTSTSTTRKPRPTCKRFPKPISAGRPYPLIAA